MTRRAIGQARVAMLGAALLGVGCRGDRSRGPSTVIPAPEWNALFDRSEGWIGGDGAASIDLGERVLWTFADSGIGAIRDGAYAPGSTLVNNAVAIHARPRLRAGAPVPPAAAAVRFTWGAPSADGKPSALFLPRRPGEWYWPVGGGALVDQRRPALLLFMARIFRPRARDDSVWNFEGRGSDLLWIEEPTADPRAWRPQIVPTPGSVGDDGKPPARRVTWGTSVWTHAARRATELYVFGLDTTDPLDKKAILAKVGAPDVRDTSRWRFWAAGPRGPWSADLDDAAPVAENVTDELSVSVVAPAGSDGPSSRRFVMVYSEPMLGRRIFARSAWRITGPWSPPTALYECPERAPAADPRVIVYAAKAHRELSAPGELLISYCVGSTDFWYTLAHATLYRPRFIRVPLALLPEPPGDRR
jgi:hypothetical protein